MGKLLNQIIKHGIFIENAQKDMERCLEIIGLKKEIQGIETSFLTELVDDNLRQICEKHLLLLNEIHTAKEAVYCDMAFKKGICLGVELLVELLTD